MRRLQAGHLASLLALGLAGCGTAPMAPSAPSAPTAQDQQSFGSSFFQSGAPTTGSSAPASTGGPPVLAAPPPLAGNADGRLIAFASNRQVSGNVGGYDIFLYDRAAGTVYALPAINTPADELQPRLSPSGAWMLFTTNVDGPWQIRLYDMVHQTINTLGNLNTPYDQSSPSIDDSGTMVAYVSDQPGFNQLRLHDLATGQTYIPAPLNNLYTAVSDPCISGNGRFVTFSALGPSGGQDIYLYDVARGVTATVPFIDTWADELEPVLSDDGNSLLFVSNLHGDDDIYLADLATGLIDHLAPANSLFNETDPQFLGPDDRQVLFQSNRTGLNHLYVYDRATTLVDPLPIANAIGWNDVIGQNVGGVAGGTLGGIGGYGYSAGGYVGFGGRVFGGPGIFGRGIL